MALENTRHKLKHAIRWSNGMVMSFDEQGEQLSELQGPYTESLCRAVLEAATADASFQHGVYRSGLLDVARDEWGGVFQSYRLVEEDGSEGIYCLWCKRTSFHPQDVAHRFCGACHAFHQDIQARPRFRHNCRACTFLGHYHSRPELQRDASQILIDADLYVCRQQGLGGLPTVIARYRNEPEGYVSGLALAEQMPALKEAKARAIRAGLLKPE